jgi:parallel beta-helix repeat protein
MPSYIKEKGILLAIALVTIIALTLIISLEPQTQASLENQPFQIDNQLVTSVYTVLSQQDSYWVKNRQGIVELQTKDASKAINYALIQVANQGGKVFIASGDYLITTTLQIFSNTILEGEAMDDPNNSGFGTRLIAANTLTGSILINANPQTGDSIITIRDLAFNGARQNKDLNMGSSGIILRKTARCRIVDVAVYNCKDSGIIFDGNQGTVEAIIERITSRGNNYAGLLMKTQSDFHIYNSEFGSNQGPGVVLSSCSSGSIIGTNVFLNNQTGILLYNTRNMRLIGNRVNHNGYSGIEITSNTQNRSEYNTLIGNECYNNGQQSTTEAGIKINPKTTTISNCLITSNICFDDQLIKTQDFGILAQKGATDNLITQNLCRNNKLQDIKISESTTNTTTSP